MSHAHPTFAEAIKAALAATDNETTYNRNIIYTKKNDKFYLAVLDKINFIRLA
jgi:hypothetical protein